MCQKQPDLRSATEYVISVHVETHNELRPWRKVFEKKGVQILEVSLISLVIDV